MNVCLIYYQFYDINPNFMREAESLVERGDQVDVISLRRGNQKGFDCVRNVNVHRIMGRRYDERGSLDYLWRMLKFFVISTLLVTKLHLWKKYDVIQITSPPDFMVFTTIIPKFLGAKVVLDIHDIVPEFYQRKFFLDESHPIVILLKWVEKLSARYADHVITVTEIWKRKLSKRSIRESKCTVIMNTPNSNLFYRKDIRKGSDNNTFKLLYHGSLKEHFGIETVVRAMERIGKEIPTARLDIYGGGNQKDYLMQLIKELDLGKWVNLNDFVPSHAIPDIIEQCNVGIVPTRDGVFAGEALSVKSMEFMSMEVPMIISRTEVSQYYYDDSMVMLFEPDNQEDLARCVFELYNNPQRREELVKNARRFTEIHNWEKYKRIYWQLLDRLCEKDHPKT